MKSVNIGDLKNNLSQHLKKVRSGEEIVVCDRNQPVARLVPWVGVDDAELRQLAAEGKLRLGSGPIGDDFWQLPAARVSRERIDAAVAAERDDD